MSNFIQWKGTDVCIDIHCPKCGKHSHFDGYFMYNYLCPSCNTIFEMGNTVTMEEIIETKLPVVSGELDE